ncbi:MAG TPA: hypothetical protein VF596_17475 [Pyrinomonadaceae bacterium]|jgi:hypothetical protein
MKNKFIILLVILFLHGGLSLTLKAQNNSDPEELSKQIAKLEERNIDDFATSLKKIYKENLLYLYKEYVSALNRQIESLNGIPDPRGDFAKKRVEYIESRNQAREKIRIVERNLGGITTAETENGNKDENKLETKISGSNDGKAAALKKDAQNTDKKEDSKCAVATIDSTTNSFSLAPAVLSDAAKTAAGRIVEQIGDENETPLEAAIGSYQDIFAFTLARAIEDEKDTESAIVNLEPLRYLPETYRTDKQIGASASTGASTSAIEKPGFPALLGFAIENGFVEKNVQDTVLTLSTSPAALIGLREKNFVDAYQNAGFLNRFGISAGFNINNDNPLLANATRSQLREYSIRFRFLGDRSANSKKLQDIWKSEIAPAIKRQLVAENRITGFIDVSEALRELRNCTQDAFTQALKAKLESKAFKALAADKRQDDLTNFYLNFMKASIFDRIQSGTIQITTLDKSNLRQRVKNLLDVQGIFPTKIIKDKLDEFFRLPTGTLAYTNHRDPLGNYSEFKLLVDTSDTLLKPLKLTSNGGFSFYHRPNASIQQRKIRDFSFAVSFEGKSDNIFGEEGDLSQITYSFTGRYSRLFENQKLPNRKADLLMGQFLVNFPIFRGFILPISVTYSNATELERKQGVQLNFGLKLDTDKFFALRQITRLF